MKTKLLRNQAGTAMTEVACAAALIVLVALASLGFMGNSVSQTFIDSGDLIKTNTFNSHSIAGRGGPAGGKLNPTTVIGPAQEAPMGGYPGETTNGYPGAPLH